jgi:hypothetical protein
MARSKQTARYSIQTPSSGTSPAMDKAALAAISSHSNHCPPCETADDLLDALRAGCKVEMGPLASFLRLEAFLKAGLDTCAEIYDKNRSEVYVYLHTPGEPDRFLLVVDAASRPLPCGMVSENRPAWDDQYIVLQHGVGSWQKPCPDVAFVRTQCTGLRAAVEVILSIAQSQLDASQEAIQDQDHADDFATRLDVVEAVFVGLYDRYAETLKANRRPDGPRMIWSKNGAGHHAAGRFCSRQHEDDSDYLRKKPACEDDCEWTLDEEDDALPQDDEPSGMEEDPWRKSKMWKPLSSEKDFQMLLAMALFQSHYRITPKAHCGDREERVVACFESEDDSDEECKYFVAHMGGRDAWKALRYITPGVSWPTEDAKLRDANFAPWALPTLQGRYAAYQTKNHGGHEVVLSDATCVVHPSALSMLVKQLLEHSRTGLGGVKSIEACGGGDAVYRRDRTSLHR